MTLIEREQPLTQLEVWLDEAMRERGLIVLLSGEAGIGKTTLLHEFAKRRSLRVLWGGCDALFMPSPLAPLRDIARQVRGRLQAAFDSAAAREVVFHAVLDVLSEEATLVVFEDVHWADEATLDLIRFMSRRLPRDTLLVISYRDDEVGARHSLRLVIGDLPVANVRRLPLAPLSPTAVEALASEAKRSSDGLHALTGGNPLFVTELLESASGAVPRTVTDAVLGRVARLSAAAFRLAELVSIVPGRTEDWLLSDAVAAAESDKEACIAIGMVSKDSGLAFRHEIARRALEDSLDAGRRRELHRRVLAALVKRADATPARLAHHADGAGDVESILRFGMAAARAAVAAGAHREAVGHFEQVLPHAAHLETHARARFFDELAYEYHLTDRIPEAIRASESALLLWRALGDRTREGDALRWMSRFFWFAGEGAHSRRYADDAIAILETVPPTAELAMAYSNRSQLEMLANQTEAAIGFARRAIALGEQLARAPIVSHALNNLGTARLMRGDVAGWQDLERSLEIARTCGREEPVARAYWNLGASAVIQRRAKYALQYLNDGIAYCEDHDLHSYYRYALAWRARAYLMCGEWAAAAIDADRAANDPRSTSVSRVDALIVLGLLRARRGDPDATGPLEEARRLCVQIKELQRDAALASAMAEVAWLCGDSPAVLNEVTPIFHQAVELGDPWLSGELAVWLYRCGGLTEHRALLAEPYALEVAGDWRGAARLWRELSCDYEDSLLHSLYGDETERRAAVTRFDDMGARAVAESLRRTLRAQGIRDLPRGARESTRANPYGLTRREAEVLEQLAAGHSNAAIAKRLFLATKTVDHHVSAVLSKLGVATRGLAIALVRPKADDVKE